MRQQHDQHVIAAAMAAARAILAPAVSKGLFSDDPPPKRAKKSFLKYSMTSLKDHQGSYWDEGAFRYDDKLAQPVITKAAAGDEDANAVLGEIRA